MSFCRRFCRDSSKILFEGNNYSDAWAEEAAKRGLSNIRTTPEALDAYSAPKSIELFGNLGIMTERELKARHEILLENYTLKIQIESRLIGELALTHILPAATKHLNGLIDILVKLKTAGIDADVESIEESVKEIGHHISQIKSNVRLMTEARKRANNMESAKDNAIAYCNEVKPYFDTIRYHADKLELMVDDGNWQLPKYRELLFLR